MLMTTADAVVGAVVLNIADIDDSGSFWSSALG